MVQPRAIFVSDVHLGCKYANTDAFLRFLSLHQPAYLYLVGDFFDGWRLSKKWYWLESYTAIVQRLLELSRNGTQIFYTPGNHDDFLRSGLPTNVGDIVIADEVIHVTADQRRLLVMHGDQFDKVTSRHRWLSRLGDVAYNLLMCTNRMFNAVWCRLGGPAFHFSKFAKRKVKELTNSISSFESTVTSYASTRGCEGIVCGHIHVPTMVERSDGVAYYNTGDWVENRTALVEHMDGRLQILELPA